MAHQPARWTAQSCRGKPGFMKYPAQCSGEGISGPKTVALAKW